jgi:hypothetical protein
MQGWSQSVADLQDNPGEYDVGDTDAKDIAAFKLGEE